MKRTMLLSFILAVVMGVHVFAAVDDTGFEDVDAGVWYTEAVEFSVTNGYISPVSETVFSPDADMTRAMLAYALYQADGAPQIEESVTFTDVPDNEWYHTAIAWAAENEIITGYGNGQFGPDDSITREQIAAILWRYAGGPDGTAALEPFNDYQNISPWAAEAVNWVRASNIMNGKSGNIFDPGGVTTRSEAAVILMGYLSQNTGNELAAIESEQAEQTENTAEASGKILIAYYSRSGNTEAFAQRIQAQAGGDLFQIITVKSYPEDYLETTVVAQEELNADTRPELTDTVENIEDYDVIFLGYPIWWGTTPMAVRTFLDSYELAGKTIIPFSTHEGSGLGSSVRDIRNLAPDANVLEGLAIRNGSVAGSQNAIDNWITNLELE